MENKTSRETTYLIVAVLLIFDVDVREVVSVDEVL
jgi:hypothetical protein